MALWEHEQQLGVMLLRMCKNLEPRMRPSGLIGNIDLPVVLMAEIVVALNAAAGTPVEKNYLAGRSYEKHTEVLNVQLGPYIMSEATNTFENVKATILSAHKSSTLKEKTDFYDSWAENYDQDVAILDYRAPSLAADSISSHFSGDREAAVVLDVACGTGLVAKQMKTHGFGQFVGIDGSEAMLELARKSGLYQDLKLSMLGEEPLPVQWGLFDVVVIVGSLSVGQVPVHVVRELCKATKPGGYVCMTTRNNCSNKEYKAALESELKQMEEEGLWVCVEVTEVEDWERAVSEHEDGYISGVVYLYKRPQLQHSA